MPDVRLAIDGTDTGPLLAVSVARSLRRAISTGACTLPLTESLEPGAEAVIRYGDTTLLTGWVVALTDDYSARTTQVDLLSRTCLLEHRSLGDTARWRGISVGEIVRQVCLWAGASVVVDAPDGPRISLDGAPEDTCWGVIGRALQGQGLAATDTGDGRLRILDPSRLTADPIRVPATGWATSLTRTRDIRERRSSYRLQAVTWADQGASARRADSWMAGLGWDQVLRAPRHVSRADAQALLEAEALRRAGESVTVSLVAPGWERDGHLLAPGDWLDLGDETLLVLDTTWSAGPGGTTWQATLGYPEALGTRPRVSPGRRGQRRPTLLDIGLEG